MAINPFNTILIFDWDDTLFPTSWLKFQNRNHNLKSLDDICVTLLSKSMPFIPGIFTSQQHITGGGELCR